MTTINIEVPIRGRSPWMDLVREWNNMQEAAPVNRQRLTVI